MEKNKIINKKNIICIISIILFIILSIMVLTGLIKPLDEHVESFIIGIRNDNLTNIMKTITNLGGAYVLIAISFLLFFIIKNKKIPLSILINLVSVFITSQIFKLIFHRSRPDEIFLTHASGYSYPSGHTMVSTAYYAFIVYLLSKNIKNKLLKTSFILLSSILILIIGFSRIYLGVHYISDVIAGLLLGLSYLMIYINIINKEVDKKWKQ